jgi:hypothetical protein
VSEAQLVFNGINGTTGEYLLPPMTANQVSGLAQGFGLDDEQQGELKARHFGLQPAYAVKEGVDPNDLAQTGWAVIFAYGADPALKEALAELLDHRREQAGDRFRMFEGAEAYRPGESKDDFLTRHGAGPGPVDPDRVPYYLLLVGDPETIPFRFQYQLDVQYAVGRIHFDTLEEYARYARSVVTAETGVPPRSRKAVFFGVRNEGDAATVMSADDLIKPLVTQLSEQFKQADTPWDIGLVKPVDTTKSRLRALLGGNETPAFLFTASHGMGFSLHDPRHAIHQGALLCQDWPGPLLPGPIEQDYYVAADDIGDDAHVFGLIAFHFACYGAGTPRLDDFAHLAYGGKQTAIARRSFIAPLPRRLLGHPRGGALATIGHVERAWACSIRWGQAGTQTEAFRSTLHRLLAGYRVGSALEPMNGRYAELSSDLNLALEDIRFGKIPDDERIAGMWTANNDARAYAIIGDPAVRLIAGDTEADSRPAEIEPVNIVTSKATPNEAPSIAPPTSIESNADLSYGWLWGDDARIKELPDRLVTALEGMTTSLSQALQTMFQDITSVHVETYVSDDLETVTFDPESRRLTGNARLRAMTHIKADGDTLVCIPETAGEVDEITWTVHAEAVRQAQSYRAELLKAGISTATALLGTGKPG